jgi:hypothetical protein
MKLFSLTAAIIGIFSTLTSQQFVKISEGIPVSDGGDSRSVNWIDYDNDGWLDLFVSNGPSGGANNFLYKNNGDGTFSKITGNTVTSDGASSDGSSWGDFDNDGDPDLFVANWYGQNNLLYKNEGGGSFTLQSASIVASDGGYSEAGSLGDYNNDGFIDLYVCNSAGTRKNFLYRNDGGGSFAKITAGDPVTDAFYSRSADWIDIDNDGDADLFVANEENQDENIYINNGNGTFTSTQIFSLIGHAGNSASSSWEDVDNDGDFDCFIANYNNQNNVLLLRNSDMTFTKVTGDPAVTDGGNSFGSAFGDVDNDGDLDLFVTNAFTAGTTKNFFYRNNGNGTFLKDTSFNTDAGWSYGCAFGDYDKNGYLDLFIAKCYNQTENNALYKNNGGSNNWLLLDLAGTVSNGSAIGAVVKAKASIGGNPVWQMRRVAGQTGYCGQTLQLHFGLGDAAVIDSLVIRWPSGVVQTMTGVAVNVPLKVTEDSTLTTVRNTPNIPLEGRLEQNFPNPFNPSTQIQYSVGGESSLPVTLKVYDTLGRDVATLVQEEQRPGHYLVDFSASAGTEQLAGGVYFYRITAGDRVETKKMIYLR